MSKKIIKILQIKVKFINKLRCALKLLYLSLSKMKGRYISGDEHYSMWYSPNNIVIRQRWHKWWCIHVFDDSLSKNFLAVLKCWTVILAGGNICWTIDQVLKYVVSVRSFGYISHKLSIFYTIIGTHPILLVPCTQSNHLFKFENINSI